MDMRQNVEFNFDDLGVLKISIWPNKIVFLLFVQITYSETHGRNFVKIFIFDCLSAEIRLNPA